MVPNTNRSENEEPVVALATTKGDEAFNEAVDANIGEGGITVDDFPRLKLPAKGDTNWMISGAAGPLLVPSIDGVILYQRSTRAYWELEPDAPGGGKKPPNCTSTNGAVGIGNPGGVCIGDDRKNPKCPFARYGSAKGGTAPGQACKEVTQLIFLRDGNMLPEIIGLPPTSVKPTRQYLVMLTGQKKPYFTVGTKIAIVEKKSAGNMPYSVAVLTRSRLLEGSELTNARDLHAFVTPQIKGMAADTDTAAEASGAGE